MSTFMGYSNLVYSLPEGNYKGTIESLKLNDRLTLSILLDDGDLFVTSFQNGHFDKHPITALLLESGVKKEELLKYDLDLLLNKEVTFSTSINEKNGVQFCNANNFKFI